MKELYQITQKGKRGGIPCDWYKLPGDAIERISPEYIHTVLAFDDQGLFLKSIVYLRKVSKFRKGLKEFKYSDSIVFGL